MSRLGTYYTRRVADRNTLESFTFAPRCQMTSAIDDLLRQDLQPVERTNDIDFLSDHVQNFSVSAIPNNLSRDDLLKLVQYSQLMLQFTEHARTGTCDREASYKNKAEAQTKECESLTRDLTMRMTETARWMTVADAQQRKILRYEQRLKSLGHEEVVEAPINMQDPGTHRSSQNTSGAEAVATAAPSSCEINVATEEVVRYACEVPGGMDEEDKQVLAGLIGELKRNGLVNAPEGKKLDILLGVGDARLLVILNNYEAKGDLWSVVKDLHVEIFSKSGRC